MIVEGLGSTDHVITGEGLGSTDHVITGEGLGSTDHVIVEGLGSTKTVTSWHNYCQLLTGRCHMDFHLHLT